MALRLNIMHILLIEDDVQAAEYLVKGLGECGHVVDHAADGNVGLNLALNGHYDVIVVDRMLPERDGLTIVRMLRADRNPTPVLILSALGEVDDRVEGLRAGGDDYLVKPFAFSELLARLEALARRSHPDAADRALSRRGSGHRPAQANGHARRQDDPTCSRGNSACWNT